MDLSLFARLEGIFISNSTGNLKGWSVAKSLVREATLKLMSMREREGKAIEEMLREGVRRIEDSLRKIDKWGKMRVGERRNGVNLQRMPGYRSNRGIFFKW